MEDALRAFRLGAINLFGGALSGFLLIFIAIAGLLVPFLAIALKLSGINWEAVTSFVFAYRWSLIGITLILSYIAGYILRLTSPDELDKKSIEHVLGQIEDEEKPVCPCSGKEGDKFPYFNFHKYLEARGHEELLKYVNWGENTDEKLQNVRRLKYSK